MVDLQIGECQKCRCSWNALAGSTAATGMNADGSIASMAGATLCEFTGAISMSYPADRATTGNLLTAGVAGLVANAIQVVVMLKKLLKDKLD